MWSHGNESLFKCTVAKDLEKSTPKCKVGFDKVTHADTCDSFKIFQFSMERIMFIISSDGTEGSECEGSTRVELGGSY